MHVLKGITRLPLLAFSLSFIIGIALGAALSWDKRAWLMISGGIFLILLLAPRLFRWLSIHRPGWVRAILRKLPPKWIGNFSRALIAPTEGSQMPGLTFGLVCLLALTIGAARYQFSRPEFTPADLAWHNDYPEPVEVIGVITRPPDVRESHTQVVIEVEELTLPDADPILVEGRLLAYLPASSEPAYGDRIRVWGLIQTPPVDDDFSYKDYLARQSIYSYMSYTAVNILAHGQGNRLLAPLYVFKQKGLDLIYTYLPDPEASLVAGIVLGVESGIPDAVDQAFKDTGTTHVIAISGFNITIVSGLFAILFGRMLGPRRGAVAALAAISLYTVLVGGDAAVIRAAIMGGLSLFARQVGRRQHGLNSLGITAAVMAAFKPDILGDIGFQLSFAATLGLVLYAQPWEEALRTWLTSRFSDAAARFLTGPISEYFLLTLAAQLVTFPIIVYHFGRLSLSSLPANVAILPAQPPIMSLGGLSVLLGAVWRPLGHALAYAVWPFAAYTIRMVEWFSRWEGGVRVIGGMGLWMVIGFYLLLFALTVYWKPILEALRSNLRPALILGVLLVAAVLVWQAALNQPDGKLHLTMLEVGDGEAVLIESPDGRYVLIGGGESATRLADGLGRRLPLFHRKLDVLVVAGTRRDQLAALPAILPRYRPERVWWAGHRDASGTAGQVYAWLSGEEIQIGEMAASQTLDLGQGVELRALSISENGAVLLLVWEDFRVLLPIGAGKGDLASPAVMPFSRDLSAVLLSRSGDLDYNPANWLQAANPAVVLLSVGTGNRSSLPDAELLAELDGYLILRTDLNGSVELVTDGDQMWVYAESE